MFAGDKMRLPYMNKARRKIPEAFLDDPYGKGGPHVALSFVKMGGLALHVV